MSTVTVGKCLIENSQLLSRVFSQLRIHLRVKTISASIKLGDTLGMLIWREIINGMLCCFGGNTDK